MNPVISIGSLKTSGSSSLALTLASVIAAVDAPVLLIDAARDADLVAWARLPGRPSRILVEPAQDESDLERLVRDGRRRGDVVIIDASDRPSMIRAGACQADRVLIPVRFSPFSAHAGVATDRLLRTDAEVNRRSRHWCFVASAVTTIPSRIARALEAIIGQSDTPRFPIGLTQRAAYEAPFLNGGTIYTLSDDTAPGLERARDEAWTFALDMGLVEEHSTARWTQDLQAA
ncbi:chromosome partitioning protein ParA [Consotaella aegiceratis]|uniref:chromosome partitioning protein ParA n=1 Tax=Consotaella aegiceratis TaxID=3097961 RepID=UPI002F40F3AD